MKMVIQANEVINTHTHQVLHGALCRNVRQKFHSLELQAVPCHQTTTFWEKRFKFKGDFTYIPYFSILPYEQSIYIAI